jgi:ABC-type antimicrobial peptide transport system permease subunit
MRHTLFYFRYAAKNLLRSGHWTTFAIFCVAAGVATVVALRSLGLAITDSLLSNLRQYNHGDINLSTVNSFGPLTFAFQTSADQRNVFTPAAVNQVQRWADARGARITPYSVVSNLQITNPAAQSLAGRPQFASSYLIDPQTFALATDIRALDPAGIPLRQLFTGGQEVVLSQNLAGTLKVHVGDTVRVSGTEKPFVVRGIVPTEAEASVNNILAAFFGFAYFDMRQAKTLQLPAEPNNMGIVLEEGAASEDIETAVAQLRQLIYFRDANTTPWLLERNREVADMISRFIVTMGLGALLIGGVGIMNTMLVLVGRRTFEIAALKTFGLKGRQVAALFVTEAFLLAVIGSALGVVAGLFLSLAVNRYGEIFLQQHLPWRLHGEAILYGVGLGMVVTMVFGVLPVLTTTKVRPGIILRPNETHLARAGLLQTVAALLIIIITLGIIVGQILGPVVENFKNLHVPNPIILGILGVTLTLGFLGLLLLGFWILVWLVGRLPSLGSVDLRLALRNLSSRRLRTATTLLALTAGMFALSSITYFGLGAREVVRFRFSDTLGGNIIVVSLVPPEIAQPLLNLRLAGQPGIQSTTQISASAGRITAVDGKPIPIPEARSGIPLTMLARESTNPALRSGPVLSGRDLTPEDEGKNVVVLSEQSLLESVLRGYTLEEMGIKAGSKITVRNGRQQETLEVIGIVGNSSRFTPNIAGAYLPPGIPGLSSRYPINVLQVAPEHINDVLLALSTTPLILSVDVNFVDGLLQRIITQMSAIPTVVGLLSLLAAGVIMANSVSLATLERRRQIGILKAIGLKRKRVLWVMLLENTVIGLLGSLLGIGISALGVALLTTVGAGFTMPIPRDATTITVALVVASVGIAWLATLFSARVAISERVAKVLHYE